MSGMLLPPRQYDPAGQGEPVVLLDPAGQNEPLAAATPPPHHHHNVINMRNELFISNDVTSSL